MKRAIVVATFLGGAIVGLVGWSFLGSSPTILITNAGGSPVRGIHIETDVGESYRVGTIAASASVRVHVSGRDKLLWVVAELSSTGLKESERIYVTSGIDLNCAITNEAVLCTMRCRPNHAFEPTLVSAATASWGAAQHER